jgi:hypothetical protein
MLVVSLAFMILVAIAKISFEFSNQFFCQSKVNFNLPKKNFITFGL